MDEKKVGSIEKSEDLEQTALELKKQKEPILSKVTTLEKLGFNLPLGVLPKDGTRNSPLEKAFSFKPWLMNDESPIGKLKRKYPRMGKFVPELLNYFLEDVGGSNLSEFGADVNDNKRLYHLHSLYTQDVLYMYFMLRFSQLGGGIYMDMECPYCSVKMKDEAFDLGTITVNAYDDGITGADLVSIYEMKNPFKYGENKISLLELVPANWSLMLDDDANNKDSNSGTIKSSMIVHSINNLPELGTDFHKLPEQVVKTFSKRDVEGIRAKLDQLNAGPEIRLETTCKECGRDVNQIVPMDYEVFFSASSK